MPFKSEKQRRYLWANEPEIAREWTDRYGAAHGGITRLGFRRGNPHSDGQSSSTSSSNDRSHDRGGDRHRHVSTPTRSRIQNERNEAHRRAEQRKEIARQEAERQDHVKRSLLSRITGGVGNFIRGAGNILGKEQSGYVISIGLHLYSKLISEAKNMLLKNEKPLINEFDLDYEIPNIQLNLHLEFGDNYISEQKIKFELYKRLNLCQSLEEIESMQKQITNRYGKLYPEGENVIFNSSIQILAKNCDIKSITKKQQIIEIIFHELSLEKSLEINKLNNKISFISNKVKIEFNEQNWKKELLTLLQNLSKSNE